MNIIFNTPPVNFNHWCSNDKINNNCLDCAYIKKYNVEIIYAVYKRDGFILYNNEDHIDDYGEFCLMLFYIHLCNTDRLYVSIFKQHPSITTEYIEDNFFYDDVIEKLYTV